MYLDVFPAGELQANCILLADGSGGPLAVIDPGGEAPIIADRIARAGRDVTHLLHTHGHLDHAGGTAELAGLLGHEVVIGLHPGDLELYRHLARQGGMFGLEMDTPPEPTLLLEAGQRIALGELELEVRHAPGHSPGGVIFVVHGAPEPLAIVGDLIFAGSVGRTDLWGGDAATLARSVREQVYTLDERTRLVPGHGPATSVGDEMRSNPFVRPE